MDLVNQTAKQLTEGAGDNTFGGYLSPYDNYLFYVKNEKHFQRVDLTTLEEVTIYTVPDLSLIHISMCIRDRYGHECPYVSPERREIQMCIRDRYSPVIVCRIDIP